MLKSVSYTHLDVYKRQVLDIRLACGAVSVGDAVKAVFRDAQNTAFQKRQSEIYRRKDDVKMIFQNNRHKQLFEAERSFLRKPVKKVLAVLYLLTADHILWRKTKHLFSPNGRIDFKSVRLGDVPTDCYAPVSYTHLDVYKRQAPLPSLSPFSCICPPLSVPLLVYVLFRRNSQSELVLFEKRKAGNRIRRLFGLIYVKCGGIISIRDRICSECHEKMR